MESPPGRNRLRPVNHSESRTIYLDLHFQRVHHTWIDRAPFFPLVSFLVSFPDKSMGLFPTLFNFGKPYATFFPPHPSSLSFAVVLEVERRVLLKLHKASPDANDITRPTLTMARAWLYTPVCFAPRSCCAMAHHAVPFLFFPF